MGDISKAVVRIGGLEYTIKGKESEEYLHKVAICVDRKMREIEKTHFNLSTSMLAVLASVNMADDMLKSEEKLEASNEELEVANEEIEALKKELDRLSEEVEILNEMLIQLEKENKTLKEAIKKPNAPVIYDVARGNRSNKR